MNFSTFSAALAKIESGNTPYAWGDGGQAMGRWQMHPAFIFQWMPTVSVKVTNTWDDIELLTLQSFWNHYTTFKTWPFPGFTQDRYTVLAMIFHLGATAVLVDKKWDEEYQDHFEAAIAVLNKYQI